MRVYTVKYCKGGIMKDKKVLRSFVMISQIGISMMVPVFLCGAIGYWLNNWLHQELLFLFMLFLGIGAAFRNLYLLTRSFYAGDLKKEREKAEYMRNLKEYHKNHPDEDFSDVMEGKQKRYPEHRGRDL
ncbi:AtpZ/AtpI family protein [bacterium D16-51]|nr:AtpZ/AtpI family protein [bacterium D16-59]RKI60487.1 AtpZ/AtpI family protein [bacterium D16-51]